MSKKKTAKQSEASDKDIRVSFIVRGASPVQQFRSNNAKENVIEYIMDGRDYIIVTASDLRDIIDSYDIEKFRLKRVRKMNESGQEIEY